MEAAFEQDRCQERIDRFRFTVLFAIPLYDAFLLTDYLCKGQSFGICLAVRLGIVTPLALVCVALVNHVGQRSRDVLFAVTPLPSMACVLFLCSGRADMIALGQLSLVLFLLYSIYAMCMNFRYACCFVFATVLGDSAFLINYKALDFAQTTTFISLLCTTALLSLYVCYSMERQVRISYRLRRQLRSQNTELTRISTASFAHSGKNAGMMDNRSRP
jgi:hypothetical protein